MSRLDADALLCRALERSADAAGVELTIQHSAATRWASATFAGARHEITCAMIATNAADRWLGDLPEADLPLRGHLVADLKVVAVTREGAVTARLEVLTVAD